MGLVAQQDATAETQDLKIESSDISEPLDTPSYETIPDTADESVSEPDNARSFNVAHWVELDGPV